jgi:hypothetical protein
MCRDNAKSDLQERPKILGRLRLQWICPHYFPQFHCASIPITYQATVMHDTSSADKGYAGKEVTAGGTRIRPFKSNLTFCVVCDCVFTLQTDEWCLHNQIFALIECTM